MNPLNNGFHRHHKDGKHENNTYENLELLCIECHHAQKDVEGLSLFEQHRVVEREVGDLVRRMINEAFDKKMSGANMERMLQGFSQMLSISRNEKGLNLEVEYPPADVKLQLSKNIQEQNLEEYMRGIRDGIRMIRVELTGGE